jgi:UDP-N-acetylmuramoyl-tripeptide--D-alanyl-D-alanine ligase
MADYDYLKEMSTGIREIKTYGTSQAETTGEAANHNEFLEVVMTGGTGISSVQTHLVGVYNLPNVLAAIAMGRYFKVADQSIKAALEEYIPTNSRSQMMEKDGNKIILDAYNANPSSMKAAIENFAALEGNNKILLLGGMMELGEESQQEHKALIELIQKYHWQQVVLVGGDFNTIPHPYLVFPGFLQAREWLHQQHLINATLLIKGSRSMQMEKILE